MSLANDSIQSYLASLLTKANDESSRELLDWTRVSYYYLGPREQRSSVAGTILPHDARETESRDAMPAHPPMLKLLIRRRGLLLPASRHFEERLQMYGILCSRRSVVLAQWKCQGHLPTVVVAPFSHSPVLGYWEPGPHQACLPGTLHLLVLSHSKRLGRDSRILGYHVRCRRMTVFCTF